MRISPTVPSPGKNGVRSGILIKNKFDNCLTVQPKHNNRITDGILVSEEVRSNIYAKINSIQMVIMIAAVIFKDTKQNLFDFQFSSAVYLVSCQL